MDNNLSTKICKSLCDQEFDAFLEVRVENDVQFNVLDINPQEFYINEISMTQKPFDFNDESEENSGIYPDQYIPEGEQDFEPIILESDINYSVEENSQISQMQILDNS